MMAAATGNPKWEPADRGRDPFPRVGVERSIDGSRRYVGRPQNLVRMLARTCDRVPERLAVCEIGGRALTYADLWEQASATAGGLRAMGIERRERVGILMPNVLLWVIAFWAIQLADAVAVPINNRLTEGEVNYIEEDSGAKYVFRSELDCPKGPPIALDDAEPDDLAAIFYTSGTTGFPKGAMTSHRNFLAATENCVRCVGIDRDEGPLLSTIINVPLFHVTGCNAQFLLMADLGGTAHLLRNALEFEPYLRTVSDHGVQILTSVPAVYHAMLRHPAFETADVSHVRWLSYGGAPIAPAAVRQIQDAFPQAMVGNGFGLTETASVVTYLPHGDAALHADSVGYAMPVVDLAVDVHDEATGTGEILVRGESVTSGYWQNAPATEEALRDGWLRTGDLGRVVDGRLYIVDRAKDMINRGGENVYSVEVEAVLANAPGVAEVAVVGVPDSMMGEKVGAVIVALGDSVDLDEILDHALSHLAGFKVPQYVVLRSDPLPRNAGGKILKHALRGETDWGSPVR